MYVQNQEQHDCRTFNPVGLQTKQFCVQLMKAYGVKTSYNQLVLDSVLCMLQTNLPLINNVAIDIDVANIRH